MKKLIALGVILLLFVVACGKKEVKKESADSKVATEAFALAEKLRVAYLKNDAATIKQYTTSAGYAGIMDSRKHFDSAELAFSPAFAEIEGEKVLLYVSWNGAWKTGSKLYEDRGLGVFDLRERPLRLERILRANPFAQPE